MKTKRWLGIPKENMMNLVVTIGEGIDTILTITKDEEQFINGLHLIHIMLSEGPYKDLFDDYTWENLINATKRALWQVYQEDNDYMVSYDNFYNLVKKYYKNGTA